jgi:hypothetical protein
LRKNIEKQFHSEYPQKSKYLGINITTDVKNPYKENYKPPKKEIEEYYRNNGKISHAQKLVEST